MTVKRLLRSTLVAGVIVGVSAVAFHASTVQWPSGMGDLQSYWHAAEALRAGGEGLYDPSTLPEGVWPYLYPPAFVGAFAVLLLLPLPVAFGAWALVVMGSVALAFLSLRALGNLEAPQLGLLGLALALPTFQLIVMGQVDALVVALLALALLADRADRSRWTGLLIGAAAALKVLPGLALLPFLVLRRWSVAAYALLALGVASLLPLVWLVPELGTTGGLSRLVDLHVGFVEHVLTRGLGQQASVEWMLLPTNASLPGTTLRLIGEPRWGALAMWALVGGATWTAFRRKRPAMGVALVVTGAALGNFVFWPHSVLLFGLPLALAFSTAGAVILLGAFAAVTWIHPVLGTVGYLAVWGATAVGGVPESSSGAVGEGGATATDAGPR